MKTFYQFLEGKAILLSPDMVSFSEECLKIINSKNWNSNIIYQRDVNGGKYGNRLVKLIHDPARRELSAGAEPLSGNIYIGVKLGNNYGDNLIELINHELIHIFDPKLTNINLRQSPWGIENKFFSPYDPDSQKRSAYYTSSWEQDAYMSQMAKSTVENMLSFCDNDKECLYKSLQTYKPEEPAEMEFYKYPKMWRKYLNTIYAITKRL